MQTLVFNTTTRTVKLYDGHSENLSSGQLTQILYEFANIPTVRVSENYYEVVQEDNDNKYPILRVPISNTNMKIER